MSTKYRKNVKNCAIKAAKENQTRITSMKSHKKPASFVVEFTRSRREYVQHGFTDPVDVEEEITLQASARNLETGETTFCGQILPHLQWMIMKTLTT